jgi:hypothetical protein
MLKESKQSAEAEENMEAPGVAAEPAETYISSEKLPTAPSQPAVAAKPEKKPRRRREKKERRSSRPKAAAEEAADSAADDFRISPFSVIFVLLLMAVFAFGFFYFIK